MKQTGFLVPKTSLVCPDTIQEISAVLIRVFNNQKAVSALSLRKTHQRQEFSVEGAPVLCVSGALSATQV